MSVDYTPIKTHALHKCSALTDTHHLPEIVYLDDPATQVMIDFAITPPSSINWERPMVEARRLMEHSQLHVCIATDDHGCIAGLIALEDILGEKPVKMQHSLRIERSDLKVKHLMIPIAQLEAIDYDTLKPLQVGHVIATLNHLKQHYVLVANVEHGEQALRGIFIDSQISKQLGTNIRTRADNLSIAELQARLTR
ncbi:MAG: hypothetical protein K5Q00_02560 [Gammaproteobacteria bacterium]|nr:hypothetical protein [Gammaproteobacteria bacterium]